MTLITLFPLLGLPLLPYMPPPPTLRAPQMKLVSLISGLGNFPDSLRWVISLSTVALGTVVLSCGIKEEMRIS